MKKQEVDQFFDEFYEEAVKSSYQSITQPDSTESFNKVKKLLDREKKKRLWKRRMQLMVVSASLIFFGAFAFGDLGESKAFYPIYKVIQQMKDGVISFIFDTNDNEDNKRAKTPPPPDFDQDVTGKSSSNKPSTTAVSIRKQVSLEEAQEEVMFDFYLPEYIPEGYKLEIIEVFYKKKTDEAHLISLWYEDSREGSFGISQRQLGTDALLSAGIDKSVGTSKELQIQGYPSILVLYKDGRINIKSLFDTLFIDMSGTINEEQIITIAESLK